MNYGELSARAAADAAWTCRSTSSNGASLAENWLADVPHVVVHNAGDIVPTLIPPRGWLLGTSFCRKFLSGLIAEGGGAKTTIRYVQYLSVATGRSLSGEHVHHRVPVMIVCLEDDLAEVQRRIAAAMLHHGIAATDVRDYLFYCCPRGLKILKLDPDGVRVVGDLYGELTNVIRAWNIGLVALDPLVKAHGVEENDNNAMDEVCTVLSNLADEFNCAVDIVHHARKGAAQPGDAERSRGASATVYAARLMRTATAMTEEEAGLFGVAPEDRPLFVRVDDAKLNLAPRSGQAAWFRLVSVALGNVSDLYPKGDHVPTVERWTPPDLWQAPTATFNAIIDEIDAGLPGGRLYSHQGGTRERAAWPVVTKHLGYTEDQARNIIKTWIKNEVLRETTYDDPVDRKERKGLRANPVKRPG
jgi:hypothetical protein